MNINCPHCGTEYEVEKQNMYRYTTCEACGNGFVVGATTSLRAEAEHPTSKVTPHVSHQPSQQMWTNTLPHPKQFGNVGKTNGMDAHNLDFSQRQVNIYGYREWFIGGKKNPVTVMFSGGTREVPYKGNVTITAKVNERLIFSWTDFGGNVKNTEVAVGDVKNIVLSVKRKDWSLHATKTNDPGKLLESNSKRDALRMLKVAGIVGALIVGAIWAANEQWGLLDQIQNLFDDTPVDHLGRAHEPSELRNRSSVQKMMDNSYKSQYGLDFTSHWYIKCPRCGAKLTPPSERRGQKVKCIECKHTWRYK